MLEKPIFSRKTVFLEFFKLYFIFFHEILHTDAKCQYLKYDRAWFSKTYFSGRKCRKSEKLVFWHFLKIFIISFSWYRFFGVFSKFHHYSNRINFREIKFGNFVNFCHFREIKTRENEWNCWLAKLNPRKIFNLSFWVEKLVKILHLCPKIAIFSCFQAHSRN